MIVSFNEGNMLSFNSWKWVTYRMTNTLMPSDTVTVAMPTLAWSLFFSFLSQVVLTLFSTFYIYLWLLVPMFLCLYPILFYVSFKFLVGQHCFGSGADGHHGMSP